MIWLVILKDQHRFTSLTESAVPVLGGIREWFESDLGQYVLQTESAMLDQLLPAHFGYNLAQFSVQSRSLYASSQVQNKFAVSLDESLEGALMARPAELPLISDCLDVAIVHHLLDFTESPQDILREIARVTLPMGHIVLVGFNPLSFWGAWKLMAKFKGRAPWNGSFIRPGRLMDWLNLLNFKIDRAQYAIYRPPVARCSGRVGDFSRGVSRDVNLPTGAIYVIVAQKHVGAIRPQKPVWKPAPAFGRLSVVQTVQHKGVTSQSHTPQEDL